MLAHRWPSRHPPPSFPHQSSHACAFSTPEGQPGEERAACHRRQRLVGGGESRVMRPGPQPLELSCCKDERLSRGGRMALGRAASPLRADGELVRCAQSLQRRIRVPVVVCRQACIGHVALLQWEALLGALVSRLMTRESCKHGKEEAGAGPKDGEQGRWVLRSWQSLGWLSSEQSGIWSIVHSEQGEIGPPLSVWACHEGAFTCRDCGTGLHWRIHRTYLRLRLKAQAIARSGVAC